MSIVTTIIQIECIWETKNIQDSLVIGTQPDQEPDLTIFLILIYNLKIKFIIKTIVEIVDKRDFMQ